MLDEILDFAQSEEEALCKYKHYKSKDPFPHILPALLSSAQIQVYIAKIGMIFPYFPNDDLKKEKVTSASLIMTIGPELLYWDSEGKQIYKNSLKENEPITLRPNSITFLRPAERFNMPDYIAARFNLRIMLVHRGLLLGTGPLIDPGFKGYPMIPVHNLTENEYLVRVGDDFINVEFTKIVCDINYKYDQNMSLPQLPFEYKKNRGKTFDFDFTRYIDKNVPQRKVKSSLSSVIDKAKKEVDEAQNYIDRIRQESGRTARIITWAGIFVAATLIIASLTVFFQTKSVVSDANKYVSESTIQLREVDRTIDMISKQNKSIEILKGKVDDISITDSKKWEDLNTAIENLSKQIRALETQLEKVKKGRAEKSKTTAESE
jgi:deoxycytidine triphosphate deaminase